MTSIISVFFHNDRDDGFGLRFTSETCPTVVQVSTAIVEGPLAKADPARIEAVQAELWQYARKSKRAALSEADACAAAAKIAWLWFIGALEGGEYNVVIFFGENGARAKPHDGTAH